jgi:hypothetical protein
LEVLRKEKESAKKSKQDILGLITWERFNEMAKECHILAKNVAGKIFVFFN